MELTVLDAGVLIGFLDASDLHHAAAHKALATARDRGDRLAIPASALAEVLVGPSRRGGDAITAVQEFVDRLPVEVTPLDQDAAVRAAALRAQHGSRLELPDALVVATAQALDADVVVTTDRAWPDRDKLDVDFDLVIL